MPVRSPQRDHERCIVTTLHTAAGTATHLDRIRPHEHAVPRWTVEVTDTVNSAVVLPDGQLQLHADPHPRFELGVAHVPNDLRQRGTHHPHTGSDNAGTATHCIYMATTSGERQRSERDAPLTATAARQW